MVTSVTRRDISKNAQNTTSDANPNRNPNPDPAPTQLEFVSKKRIKRISVSNDSPLKIFVSIFK